MDEYSIRASEFFGEVFLREGPTPKGVDWGTEHSQDLRLRTLLNLIPLGDKNFSVADVGCGYGRLLDFMQDLEFTNYTGYEISPELLRYAQDRFVSDQRIKFKQNEDFEAISEHDYVILSGVFNKKFGVEDDEFLKYIKHSLTILAKKSRKGLGVNFLSSFSDKEKMREDLYYSNPMTLFEFAKGFITSEVSLIHDYGLWDFTLYFRFDK
jgi:SAM-dependent methyltransferase